MSRPWSTSRRSAALAVAALGTAAVLGVATGPGATAAGASQEPARLSEQLPGLPGHEQLVAADTAWAEQALATLTEARGSVVAVASAEHPDWPPLTGFVVGERHLISAHPAPRPAPGDPLPQRLVRTLDGEPQLATEVAGWPEWDVALLEVEQPLEVPALPLGDETALSPGDPLLQIGHPSVQARSGAWITSVGSFVAAERGLLRGEMSSSAGSSGAPILDLDGAVVGVATMGFDLGPSGNALDELAVAELALRSSVPIHLEGTSGGVGGVRLAALLAEVLP